MFRRDVKSLENLIAYICDCNLATVDHLAGLKSKSKSEFKRQIDIAQFQIDKGLQLGVVFDSRAHEIITNYGGSVEKWAMRYSNNQE